MTSNTASATFTLANQHTDENKGTLAEIDFNGNDAVFEELWELVAAPVAWPDDDDDSFCFPDGPPRWEEFQKIWDAIDDKGTKNELAQRKRHDENFEIPDEDESTEHVLLHAACLRQPPVQIVRDLIEASQSTIFEKGARDMMPLHFACICKASVEVVRALLEADESKETLMAKDKCGCTPLHFACRNKESVKVVRALLEADESKDSVMAENSQKKTPIDCFAENHAKPNPRESKDQWEQAVSLLAHDTHYSKGSYFESLKKIFEADSERSFDNHFIKQLNQAMRNPFYTSFLMLDLLSNILLAAMFTVLSSSYASSLVSSSAVAVWYFVVICILLCILTVREAIKVWSEGFFVWLVDIWNFFDMANIILVLVSALIMQTGKSYSDASYGLVMATGFLTWIHTLSSLRSSFLEFAVFIVGIKNVMLKLVPFVVTTLLILCGFAYLYHMNNARAGLNSSSNFECVASSFGSYGDALFTTSAMMLNGIEYCVLAYDQEDLTVKWVSLFFALLMVVLLLNVIIAIVSSSWNEVTAKGRNVFLGNRIAFLSELKAFVCIRERTEYEHDIDKVLNLVGKECNHGYDPDTIIKDLLIQEDGVFAFLLKNPVSWESLKRPFLIAFLHCQAKNGRKYISHEVKLEALGMFLATYVSAPIQFLCGLVTLGYFWPPAFRQFLFQIEEIHGEK